MKNFLFDIKNRFLFKGSFIRNITIYSTGAFFAHVVGVLFTPIITRLYSPEDYGKFALFSTILALVTSLSTLNYTEALILPKNNQDFYRLARVVFIISASTGFVILIILSLQGDLISNYFNAIGLTPFLFLIPLLVIINSFQLIVDNYNIRKKEFSKNAKAKLISVSTGKSAVVIMGFYLGSTIYGLISGEVLIRFTFTLILLGSKIKKFFKEFFLKKEWQNLIASAKEYWQYPTYVFPSTILLQLSIHLPVFIIGKLFDPENLGYYTLAMSLLGIPIQVIGFTIGKVFLQKANETVQLGNWAKFKHDFIYLFYSITFVVAMGYGIVFGFGPVIFEIIAGTNWRMAGEIARILAIGLSLQLIATVTGPVFSVLRKEKNLFMANLIGSGIMVAMFAYSILINLILTDFIVFLAAGIVVRYLILIITSLKLLNLNAFKHTFFSLGILIVIFYLFYLIAMLF